MWNYSVIYSTPCPIVNLILVYQITQRCRSTQKWTLCISSDARYLQSIGLETLIVNISVLFCLCDSSAGLLLCVLHACYSLQNKKTSGWYFDTFTETFRYRCFFKNYRNFCITMQKCSPMERPPAPKSFSIIIILSINRRYTNMCILMSGLYINTYASLYIRTLFRIWTIVASLQENLYFCFEVTTGLMIVQKTWT